MNASQSVFVSAQELVDRFGGRVDGDASVSVRRYMSLRSAQSGDASFLSQARHQGQLKGTRASLVVVPEARLARSLGLSCTLIVTDDPYLFFAKSAAWLLQRAGPPQSEASLIHPSAYVDPSAQIGGGVCISAQSVIEAEVTLEEGVQIGPGCTIGARSRIGRASKLDARVTLYPGCTLGERVLVQSGAVLGSEGFGFLPVEDQSWVKIPQLGGLQVGNDVEIGANTTIDRGTLDPTVIEDGVKLDNLIHIAHNVRVGHHTAIAACVGIAGSAKIGAYCQIGGAAGILGHLEIPDFTIIGPMTLVMSSIEHAGKYVGVYPIQEQRDWEKSAVLVRRLSQFRKQLKKIDGQDS
jgi:UDP-3-O-[3-hydroxymyristoyl] glucosamine N-acyltransferase